MEIQLNAITVDIDKEIYSFVEKISKYVPEYKQFGADGLLFGAGRESTIELKNVLNFRVDEFDEEDYSTNAKYKDVDGQLVGLNRENFRDFSLMLMPLIEKQFSNKCSIEFLINTAFEWLIDVYRNKRAKNNIVTHLLNIVESSIKEYHFFFTIKALAVERPIQIGNVEIKFFTEDSIQKYYDEFRINNTEMSIETFKQSFSLTPHSIKAIIKVYGHESIAESLAFRDVELAIDVLKCYCLPYALDKSVAFFDLDYRISGGSLATFFRLEEGDITKAIVEQKKLNGVAPISITNDFLIKAQKFGIEVMSTFIKNKKNDELYIAILDLIKQFSAIISTHNNYEKVVKAISLMESIVIRKGAAKGKGLTIIKNKIIPRLVSSEGEKKLITNYFITYNEVRDKYLHNYLHWPINKKNFKMLLAFEMQFILELIKLNSRMTSLEEVLTHFNIDY